MATTITDNDVDQELLDYVEEDQETGDQQNGGDGIIQEAKKDVKGNYVSIHSSGFRDFLLKPELLRAIVDCGFEHPSEGKLMMRFTIHLFCIEHSVQSCVFVG